MRRAADGLEVRPRREPWGWRLELAGGGAEALSWCSIVDVPMRIGGSVVLAGGIGGVGTLEAHRRKGYSRRVLETALALMRRERYAISFLHGIQDFYHKFGYITCMAEHELSVDAAAVLAGPRPRGKVRLRALKKADLPALARLYNRENAGRTGSAVRDPRRFEGFRKGTWWSYRAGVRVAVDGRDRIAGYVVYDDVPQHCRASEVAGGSAAVFDALAVFLARRAKALGHERLSLFGPADHPFAVYCRRFGARLGTLYPRNEKPMGRVVDLERCLEGVLPELERRWGRQDRERALTLQTDVGRATLRWRGPRLRLEAGAARGAVCIAQQELSLLLLGYARPSDLLAWGAAVIPRGLRDLMARLFPLQEAHMWWTDRF